MRSLGLEVQVQQENFFPTTGLEVLGQQYRRVSDTGYEYEAPTAGYSGLLEFSRHGIVVSYPGLFALVSGT